MEVFTSLVVLGLAVLAGFMYFKTRPGPRPQVLDLDFGRFSPVSDAETCGRVIEAGRGALGAGVGAGGPSAVREECLSDGDRFVYRTGGAEGRPQGKAVVLMDKDFQILGSRKAISL